MRDAAARREFRKFDPAEAGITERFYMWQSATLMRRERPLVGWGPGGVKRVYSRFAQPGAFKQNTGHVHNTPLQILAERGALGLAAWLAIWLGFYWHAVGLLKRLEAGQHDGLTIQAHAHWPLESLPAVHA